VNQEFEGRQLERRHSTPISSTSSTSSGGLKTGGGGGGGGFGVEILISERRFQEKRRNEDETDADAPQSGRNDIFLPHWPPRFSQLKKRANANKEIVGGAS